MSKKMDLWSVVEELNDEQIEACGACVYNNACGCYYANEGGSSSSQNRQANNAASMYSPQRACGIPGTGGH